MTIPRFTADASLSRTSGRYRMSRTDHSSGGVEAARMTAQWCYYRDSRCTQFCGGVNPDYRYECFSICDKKLSNCLDIGRWTEKAAMFEPA